MHRKGKEVQKHSTETAETAASPESRRDPLRLYSPRRRTLYLPDNFKSDAEFIRSLATPDRPERQRLDKVSMVSLRRGNKSSKEWTTYEPDPSKDIKLQAPNGEIHTLPITQEGMTRFYDETGLTKAGIYTLKTRAQKSTQGWRLLKPFDLNIKLPEEPEPEDS